MHPQEPAINDEEKEGIRAEIPRGLADADNKIRTAAAMAIASIACTDLPHAWPSLVGDIVRAVSSRANSLLVSGSIQCLSLFVEELDEEPLIQVHEHTCLLAYCTHACACAVLKHPALPCMCTPVWARKVATLQFPYLPIERSALVCDYFGSP